MENPDIKHPTRSRALLKAATILALAILVLGGFRLWRDEPPTGGAVLNFTSTIPDARIEISSARDQAGRPFAHPGSFHHSDNPMNGGATMGSVPGTFGLPTWIEFTWQELPYPAQPRESFSTEEGWVAYVDERYRVAPLKTGRVKVAEKVPAWALDEVAKSRAATPLDQLPDKMLWLHFVWTTDGIKVRWKIHNSERGGDSPEGGDPI